MEALGSTSLVRRILVRQSVASLWTFDITTLRFSSTAIWHTAQLTDITPCHQLLRRGPRRSSGGRTWLGNRTITPHIWTRYLETPTPMRTPSLSGRPGTRTRTWSQYAPYILGPLMWTRSSPARSSWTKRRECRPQDQTSCIAAGTSIPTSTTGPSQSLSPHHHTTKIRVTNSKHTNIHSTSRNPSRT